ncbi:MAG: ABC transporter permease [Propionicimonas sp.]|uniref:ABC transporter permease n=1 Tax=Propionicimonas sp. TaxID=1955623 RepID=UPI002B2129F1|nr:ABC transporter permease [Propionicimonas sp.]MEA4943622.1 ABC transporter permease [Propionicimonas sp.]
MTRARMYLRMITRAFVRRLSRVVIASLAIVVGATTLSALGIITYTVPEQMARELRSYGANLVVSAAGTQTLRVSDMETINDALTGTGASLVGHAPYRQDNLLYNQQPLSVMATDFGLATAMRPYWSIDGELPAQPGELLVGRDLVKRYGFEVGDQLSLVARAEAGVDSQPVTVTVSGLLRTGGPEDAMLLLSLADLESILPADGRIDMIEYSVLADQGELETIAQLIDATDTAAHAQVVKRITKSESGVLLTLRALIWIVSVIIGALTLISVTTTMNAVVGERATELALKKALGASSRELVGEFIGEGVILGLFGGLLGAVAGIAVGGLVTQEVFNLNLQASWWVVPLTMVVAALVSGLGSFLTVRRIIGINPAAVLGGE